MKLIVFSVLVACVVGMSQPRTTFEAEWEEWKNLHDKSYIKEEEYKRQMIWEENRRLVLKHNYEYDLGQHTFTMGMNRFADMTNEEFKVLYLSERPSNVNTRGCIQGNSTQKSNPSDVDWVKKGAVTNIKDQGDCGSCWAFSTTGSVEGQLAIPDPKKLVSLSEQNLIDCSGPEGDLACHGGIIDFAFEYIIKNDGIDSEASYPYMAKKQTCMFNPSNVAATVTGCVDIPSKNEKALEDAVANIGPISVAIDANHISFQLYAEGVYYEPNCSETILDHGVLAVGYGTDNNKEYWLVKNSWGESWGQHGYIQMTKNNNNNCGIATSSSYPTGVKGTLKY